MIICGRTEFKLSTDNKGYPLIQFLSEETSFELIAMFFQEEIGVFLPCCDDLIQTLQSSEGYWNGNCLLLQVKEEIAILTYLFEPIQTTIEKSFLLQISRDWKTFISQLPIQQMFLR